MKRMSKKIKITNSWGIHYRVRYFLLEYIKKYNIKEFIIECTGLEETRNPKTYYDFKDVYGHKQPKWLINKTNKWWRNKKWQF